MGEPPVTSEGDLPFGYNFSDSDLFRPPLPLGDPILDPNDNNFLGDFFTGMESNDYNTPSFGEGLSGLSGLTFSDQWFHQVAPNLLGHSTSFGPQPLPDLGATAMAGMPASNSDNLFVFGEQSMMPPPVPGQQWPRQQSQSAPQQQQPRPQSQPALHHFHQQPSHLFHDQRNFHISSGQDPQADAAALLTTLQSGHPNNYSSRTSSFGGFHTQPSPQQPQRHHRASLSQSHARHGSNDFVQQPARSDESHTLFTDMMFGSQDSTAPRPADPPALQWGSDTLFARGRGFVPPQHESIEALERRRLAAMREALTFSHSTPNTRPSSPIENRGAASYAVPEESDGNARTDQNAAAPPRKRRKSKAKIDEEGEEGQSSSRAATKRRKSKVDPSGIPDESSPPQEASGKRRKSAPAPPKPPRENLTDAQKRENHIKSEQKRRGTIKEGFDDLMFIVPNLQNGGYSKSSILNITGEWLESLVKGNETLESKGPPTL